MLAHSFNHSFRPLPTSGMSRYSPYSISVREQQSEEEWRIARFVRRAQRLVETARSEPFDVNAAVSSSSDSDFGDCGGTKGNAKNTMGKGMGKGLGKAKGSKGNGLDKGLGKAKGSKGNGLGKGLGEGKDVSQSQSQPGKGWGMGGEGEGDGKGMWMCQIWHGLEWWRWVPDEERMRCHATKGAAKSAASSTQTQVVVVVAGVVMVAVVLVVVVVVVVARACTGGPSLIKRPSFMLARFDVSGHGKCKLRWSVLPAGGRRREERVEGFV